MAGGLILTVGDSPEPIEFSLHQGKPDYACFLCTPQSRLHLDRIVASAGLPPSRYQVLEVEDRPDDAARLAHQIVEAQHWLAHRGLRPEDIVVDATGGRKWMSSAATLMAGALGLRMVYVEARYREGRPDPASMKLVSLANVVAETGIIEAARGVSLFNAGNFAAASDVFSAMTSRIFDLELRELVTALADLACLLEKWDRFLHLREPLAEHLGAIRSRLSRSRYLGERVHPLQESLARLETAAREIQNGAHLAVLADLIENARRCQRRGRYDDATARAYRALEATAQWLLESCCGLKTGAVRETIGRLRGETLTALRQTSGGVVPERIGLAQAWEVLAREKHAVALGVMEEESGKWQLQKRLRGCLKSRNDSILAHGFKAVGERTASDLLDAVEAVVRVAAGGDLYEEFRRNVSFPVLPPLAAGEG